MSDSSTKLKIRGSTLTQLEIVKNNCDNRFQVETDLEFTITRQNSYYEARITLVRLDTFEEVTIDFFDENPTRSAKIQFHVKGLICQTENYGVCKGLPPYTVVPVAILALDIDPNNGSGEKIEYSLKGRYQSITCARKRKYIFYFTYSFHLSPPPPPTS